jgi:outer membrane lipoprotein SlyB
MMTQRIRLLALTGLTCLALAGCETNPLKPTAAAPANDNNPSPTAGGATSQRANEMADKAMYKEVEYKNIAKKGPQLVVIPGEVKSNNATFTQKFGPNNIADFAELELGKANFGVLERTDLGPLMREFQLAYTMGDPKAARKVLQKGKLKTTKWVVKFDILKAEQVAQAQKSFDGQALGRLAGIAIGGREGHAVDTIGGSIKTGESTGVWVIGMRFKILDANTTEQKATGYTEEKMEVGAAAQSILGFSEGAKGGVTLDTMVQRLVQKLVWEIDSKYK